MEKYNEDPKTKNDKSEKLKNENSIAVLIEYEQCKIVLGGDGYLKNISQSLKNLADSSEKAFKIDVMKLLHHGAIENNDGIIEFIKEHKCEKLLYSANGINHKEHPNIEMIYQILKEFPKIEIYATNTIPEEIWDKQWNNLGPEKSKEILKFLLETTDYEWVAKNYTTGKEDLKKNVNSFDDKKIKNMILACLNEKIKKAEDFKNGIIVR